METKTNTPKNGTQDVYTIVTSRIIEQLEKGTVPWRKPWTDGGTPKNLISKRPYRGINIMLLAMLGYEQNVFLTYKQIQGLGGSIKKEERPHMVVYWNYIEKKNKTEDEGNEIKRTAFLRYYSVYNIAQCENTPPEHIPKPINRLLQELPLCEDIVKDMPDCPEIRFKEHRAYYNPLADFVNMPKRKSFTSDASYYSTLFHELVHSTGHRNRLDRKDLLHMSEFGADAYSHEELVAEIGTCYLQSFAGITEEFEQSAAYINGWLRMLKYDKQFIFSASTQAQKAVDFILNVHPEVEETEEDANKEEQEVI